MGAGCWYTLEEDRDIRAYWLDIGYSEDEDGNPTEDEFHYSDELSLLVDCITELPICKKYGLVANPRTGGYYDNQIYYGDSYIVKLESNYNGDGIVINFEYQNQYEDNGLVIYNYSRSYDKLIRHINKQFPLRIATSGYTSGLVEVGELCQK